MTAIRGFQHTTLKLGLAGFVVLTPGAAFAQADDDSVYDAPIVVTAQRREEVSVDVPITITTLGSDTLATANVQELADIAKLSPALRFDYSSGYFQPTIRGVGTAITTAGGQGNVGIYTDGFYSPNPLATNSQLLKVTSIQVLKGPQGTLFGRNTTGGAILIQTAEPSVDNAVEGKVSYGRYNEISSQAYMTMGLSQTVAFDAEGLYRRGDGWRTNISTGKKDGDYKAWSIRLGLKAELSDSVDVLIRYQHAKLDDPAPELVASYTESKPSSKLIPFTISNGAPFFAQPGEFTFNPDEVALGSQPGDREFFRSNSDSVNMTIRADLEFANLTSLSQYRREKVDSSIDQDYSGVEYFQLGLPNDNETWSQELLLTSQPGTDLQWTAGLFYFQNRDTYPVFFDYFPAIGIFERSAEFGSSLTTKSAAVYLDMTYEVTPKLFVTAGARYAHDWVTDGYSLVAFAPPPANVPTKAEYDAVKRDTVTPRFVIRYKPTEESSIYASYTKGYKSGFLDQGSGGAVPVKPEKISAFEVGAKLETRRVNVEISAFYYDYKDLQVSLFKNAAAQIINAASSEIYGLDAQFRYEISPQFQVTMGGAWVHARYKDFPGAPIYTPCLPTPGALTPVTGCAANATSFPIVPQDLKNVTMQRTPEFTGNVGARYRTELASGKLQLSGILSYSSKFFFGPSGIQFPQKGYETLALRAQWSDPGDNYTLALWGTNVTNSRYKTAVQYANGGIGANWSKPVTFGGEIGVKF